MKKVKSSVTYALPSDDIWSRDWDVLVVLDACRADLFADVIEPSPTLRSPAATSSTWIRRTFDRDVSNIGYITGNGHTGEMPIDEFGYFHVQPPERTDYGIETPPPEPIIDHAIHAWRNRNTYGLDRVVVHLMQPHAPFRTKPEWFDPDENEGGMSKFVWQRLRDGEFTRDEVWEAYSDNLEWVWDDAVSVLRENMDAEIAVSADHGNAVGEFGCYGHPMGCPLRVVREVPWYKIDGTDTNSHEPTIDEQNVSTDTDEHLRALGYI
jgi:hypothetical protein